MKAITRLLAALVLLSPLGAASIHASDPVSRDSIMNVVHAAEASNPEALNILGTWYYMGENLSQDYSLAARMWAKAASMGNVAAIGNLGMCYQYGQGVERDSIKAMGLYTKSLRAGNPELMESLRHQADSGSSFECAAMGHFLTEGIGCKRDYPAAGRYYAVLAKRGDVEAMRDAGLAFLNGKEYKDALKWFKSGTEQGNITCTYYYGSMLVDGLGTEANPSRGFVYALKAAEGGLANAQYLVSRLYREGRGVAASATEADAWLGKAAYKGLAKAMFEYGLLAASKNDFIVASYMFSWLNNRRSFVPQMKSLFTPTDTANILDTPFAHFAMAVKAINAGDFKTARNEIKALKKGKGPYVEILEAQILMSPLNEKRDINKAVKQLTKLAEKDDYARLLLARIYERGTDGIDVDTAMARQLLETAADNNFYPAVIALGNDYYEGLFGIRDYSLAVDCYRRAYNEGWLLADAASRFATCLDEAQGTVLNPSLASKINSQKYPAALTDFTALIP